MPNPQDLLPKEPSDLKVSIHHFPIIGYSEEGSHWYQKGLDAILYTKAQMREDEDKHIRPEHGMPGLDPIWEYNWLTRGFQIQKEKEGLKWLSNLTPEQLEQLGKGLERGN